MPDTSDILKDPTEHLRQLLNRLDENGLQVDRDVYLLHRHIRAGGALPGQWRGEGTAVGRLLYDLHQAIGNDPGALGRDISAVTGDG